MPPLESSESAAAFFEALSSLGAESREFEDGTHIFREGESGDYACLLLEGRVKICKRGADGRNKVLAMLGPGSMFGEMALLEDKTRSASALAVGRCRLYVLDRDVLFALIRLHPSFTLWMLETMSRRLRRMDLRIARMEEIQEINKRIILSRDEERRRIGRDLHDGPAQYFADYILRVGICRRLLARGEEDKLPEELEQLEDELHEGLRKIRELIYDLHPKEIVEDGLIRALASFLEKQQERIGVDVEFSFDRDEPWEELLDRECEVTLYHIVQEALTNIRKYASASRVRVSLSRNGGKALLRIEDDGRGFDVQSLMKDYSSSEHYGLSSMRERIELLGGRMSMRSAPGEGTALSFEFSLPGEGEGL